MLYLYVAALTHTGSHLVLSNYDEEAKVSYVTLWDCMNGEIKKRLKNEKNVCAMAINDAADRIVFGKETTEMRIWDPTRSNSLRRVKGYKGLKFGVNSKILLLNDGARAAVFAGDISMWDLDKGEMLSVFTPDMNVQCFDIALDGQLIVFGLRDIAKVVTLRMSKNHRNEIEVSGKDIFGEKEESSDDDSDEENQQPQQEEEEEEEE
jgi:WD40 repeat protein